VSRCSPFGGEQIPLASSSTQTNFSVFVLLLVMSRYRSLHHLPRLISQLLPASLRNNMHSTTLTYIPERISCLSIVIYGPGRITGNPEGSHWAIAVHREREDHCELFHLVKPRDRFEFETRAGGPHSPSTWCYAVIERMSGRGAQRAVYALKAYGRKWARFGLGAELHGCRHWVLNAIHHLERNRLLSTGIWCF